MKIKEEIIRRYKTPRIMLLALEKIMSKEVAYQYFCKFGQYIRGIKPYQIKITK